MKLDKRSKIKDLCRIIAPFIGGVIIFGVVITLAILNHAKRFDGVTEAQAIDVYNRLQAIAGVKIPPFEVVQSDELNAWTDGKTITFTTTILKSFRSVDEAAAVMAHEMAHNILYHFELGEAGAPQDQLEASADVYGASLMLRAGYDICQAATWDAMVRDTKGDRAQASDHPSMSYRIWAMDFPMCNHGAR